MLLPLPVILFVVLLVFSIKKAKQQVNVNKHVLIRLGVLVGFIALTFLIVYLVEGRSGTLGSFYISAYFLGAWLLYLIVEAISLFLYKSECTCQNKPYYIIYCGFYCGNGSCSASLNDAH